MTQSAARNWLKYTFIAVLLTASATGGYYYWQSTRGHVTTQNAYVQADTVHVGTQVTGEVETVYVQNNQHVQKGQVLFSVDSKPFKRQLKQASARLEKDRAALNNAIIAAQRKSQLASKNAMSQQEKDDAVYHKKQLQAAIKADKARFEQAQQDLEHTQIKAPSSGWVTEMTLQPGDTATAYRDQFALVCDHNYWVQTNLKETQLTDIKPGQPAKITVDMYPGHRFKGRVESISHASGNAFSLLPSQNTSGNWVKVTQRVPVRVSILDADSDHPLSIGTSAYVNIQTDDNTR